MRKLIVPLISLLLLLPCSSHAGLTRAIQGVIAGGGSCTASYGSELHTSNNAAYASASDYNATTGWTNSGLATFEASTTAPSLGTYHLLGTSNSDSDKMYYAFTGLTASTLYRITADVRHSGTGGDWYAGLAASSTATNTLTRKVLTSADTTYTSYDYLFYYSGYDDNFVFGEGSASNDGTGYLDNFSIKAATPCLGSELHTTANATSLGAESNATTGWSSTGADIFESTSSGTPADGTYHLHVAEDATPTANARTSFDLSTLGLQNGTHYLLSLKIKHIGSGGAWIIGLADTSDVSDYGLYSLSNTETTYFTIGIEITYSAALRYLIAIENNANNDGGLYIDSLSVKEIVSK